jgi:hypothetical protein
MSQNPQIGTLATCPSILHILFEFSTARPRAALGGRPVPIRGPAGGERWPAPGGA